MAEDDRGPLPTENPAVIQVVEALVAAAAEADAEVVLAAAVAAHAAVVGVVSEIGVNCGSERVGRFPRNRRRAAEFSWSREIIFRSFISAAEDLPVNYLILLDVGVSISRLSEGP